MEEEKKVEELQITDETGASEEILPERYSGSGENRNPSRVLKIDEIVKWDMNFGVVVGPAGYDHRLRCPYCGKRLLLLEYEGGRDRTGIRVAYRCENCSAHSVVSFLPPGQNLELDEVAYGERIVVEKPTPVPNTPTERDAGRPQRRDRQNQNQRGNQGSRGAQTQQGENSAQTQSNPRNQNQQRRNQNQRPAATGERAERDNRSRPRNNNGSEGQRSAQQGSRNPAAAAASERNERAENQNRRRQNTRDQSSAAAPDVQAISEAVQDQADKTATRRPYQRRRRRPFRPPTTPSNSPET